ncbi:MAG: GDP-fucose synthetase [Deltaproteobacteria bacterium RIFOXYD12_FULL_50_9]|nr:MAG: GDP-fucose synthetase [Deltaproteobacteria bacterium RIFOXYD12_FULL_50_9]
MDKNATVYIAGHRGLVGSAILREFLAAGHNPQSIILSTHAELNLANQAETQAFFENKQPDYVILAAAKVGGIMANNTYPADFIYDNLIIQANVIHAAYLAGVKRLLFLGSSCIYPRSCPQPIKEEYLLTGPLEPTNRPYALAKIAGIEQCWSYNRQYRTRFLAVMPTNLYGSGDHYDLNDSHVIPALIRKFHLAKLAMHGDWQSIEQDACRRGPIPEDIMATLKEGGRQVILWGDGSSYREFMYINDMAKACLFLMQLPEDVYNLVLNLHSSSLGSGPPLINVGTGEDLTIREMAAIVAEVVGYHGEIIWDTTKPNGTPRKVLDVTRIKRLGWSPGVKMADGLQHAYAAYLKK